MSRPSLTLGLAVSLAFAASGCSDNVTCVFIDGCTGGGGAISENEAVQPIDGEWIVDGPPEVDGVFPSGVQNAGTTPIVLVFSESMQAESLQGAFEVLAGGQGQPISGLTQALVSDGRVLVLLSRGDDLDPGEYVVRLEEDAVPLDLTGQVLDLDPLVELGTFTVVATPPTTPRLVTTFPPDRADDQAETTEIVAVFDRPVLPSTVTQDSFDVRVDGADPANDPPASVLVIGGVGSDTRVFLYRSLGADGRPAPLGTGAQVDLILSPAGDPISEMDGGDLPADTITFDTLPFAPPLAASVLSDPSDAIGLANLTDGDPEELMVEVELDAAQPDDFVDLFLFGVQKSSEEDPPLIALQRQVRLSGAAPIQSVIFTREDVAMQLTSAADNARFEDGAVTFAFRTRRGSAVTPVRLLDLDPDPDTIQDLLLDTIRPTIEAFEGSTGTATFRSDQRGVSLAGTADEELRSVEVTTPMATNGALAPVVGTTPTGTSQDPDFLFLAAPVDLGLVAGGSTTYSAVARDEAQNASAAVNGTFTQLGAVGPGAFSPGNSIEVEVFDSRTLEVLSGALVLVHSDRGNGVDFPFFASDTTGPDGRVMLVTEGAPSVGAIVTVERAGYDLLTLHGVPSTRLSLPLCESNLAPARTGGFMRTSDPGAVAFLQGLDQRFDDSRRAPELPRGFAGFGCDEEQGVLTCSHGPEEIRDERLGAHAFFAGDFSQTEAAFQSTLLLRAFALELPFEPVEAGALGNAAVEVEFLLDDPAAPPEEAVQAVPAFTFEVQAGSGVDLGMLQGGAPSVSVETLVPGLAGSIAVALGLAFDQGGDLWTVRAVQPGAITPAGSLGSDGRVDTDPFVRVEVLDVNENAAGVRPRLSAIQAGGPMPVFRALAAPIQLAPAEGAQSGGQAFTLRLTHAIGDDRSEAGLYRVELLDESGRGWILWRFDAAGAADVEIRVVDVAAEGGVGLDDGELSSTAAAFAWSSLVSTAFLWSDVEREFELFSRAAPRMFFKP